MAPNMKAAFTLVLEDKLTAGLKKIEAGFQELKRTGKELGLGKLGERGADVLRTLTEEARNLTSSLRTVEAVADRGWAAMRRMASVTFRPLGQAFGKAIHRKSAPDGMREAAQAVGGYYALTEPAHAYANYENIARHSAITMGLSAGPATAESQRLMGIFNQDALDTGQSSESIAQAYQDLIQTGIDPKRALGLLPIHSRAATAYNISPEALGHAVFALFDSFKIDETGMGGALASMALASKAGRFKVEDFSRYLPSIGGDFAKLGMTGRGNADIAFASLETVMKNAADPGSGAANFKDLMNAITSPHSARTFALEGRGMAPATREVLRKYHVQGINLPAVLADARGKGIDPLTAVMRTLSHVVKGLPTDVRAEVLGAYLGNQQARDAAQSLLMHPDEFNKLLDDLHRADTKLLDRDFETAHAAPKVGMDTAGEGFEQLKRRLGQGFEPVIEYIGAGAKRLLSGIESLDGAFPGLGNAVLLVTGGLLALSSALAAIGFIAPAVGSGAALAASAGSGLVAAGAAVAGSAAAVPLGLGAVGIGAAAALAHEGYQIPWVDPNTGMPMSLPPVDLTPPSSQGATAGGAVETSNKHELEVTVRAAPGTEATVTRASPGVTVPGLNPGQTTALP